MFRYEVVKAKIADDPPQSPFGGVWRTAHVSARFTSCQMLCCKAHSKVDISIRVPDILEERGTHVDHNGLLAYCLQRQSCVDCAPVEFDRASDPIHSTP